MSAPLVTIRSPANRHRNRLLEISQWDRDRHARPDGLYGTAGWSAGGTAPVADRFRFFRKIRSWARREFATADQRRYHSGCQGECRRRAYKPSTTQRMKLKSP